MNTRPRGFPVVRQIDSVTVPAWLLHVIRPEPRRRGVSIYQEDGVYVVQAPGVERIAQRIDYEDWLARMQFYKHMQKTGVVKALEDAGISEGDTVRIGDVEWEWD